MLPLSGEYRFVSISVAFDVVVPYRNSVLTKLLKNALGGNSKTIMVGCSVLLLCFGM